MPIKSIPKFLAVVPDLLEANGWERRQGAMTFLTELGLPQERLGACLARHPRVLDLSFETMSSVVDFLVVEGGIPRAKVSKIVEVMPSLLSHSVDRNLRPKISFLVEDVGIAPEGLAAVLLKFPQVLGLSVEGNLRPTVRYLTDELGVMHSDLSRILTSMPQLLGLSVQGNLQVKVKYLVSELGIPKDRIRDIVVMSPALLSLSVEKNLLPKVQFLVEEAGFSVQEIIKAPNILAYSLDRMRSRHEFLTKKGLKLGLASMVSYSNTEFQRRFDHDGDLL
jgi:mTERF domain-containing protein